MKVRRVNVVVLNVILLVFLVVSVNGSVWNECYCQALPVSCETSKVVLQSGTAGTSTIYTNNTSAKVSVIAPALAPINWWDTNYHYRKRVSIMNNMVSTLTSGYSICLTVNTTSLVSDGKMQGDGDDCRIVFWNVSGLIWKEIDRVNLTNFNTASTEIWFKLQKDIAASSSDNNYFLYYGYSDAANPPAYWSDSMGADASSKVYVAADDFQEHNSGDSPDGWDPCDGYFNVEASGSNKFMNSTANGQYVFAGSSAWTDYVVKVKMQAPTGSVSYPGIAVRVTDVSNLVYFGWKNSTTLTLWKRINGTYTNLGDWTIPNAGTAWHTIEIRAKGQDLYVYHDGTYYGSASLGAGELTSGKVGIFSSYGTHAHWDDYTVRKYVFPEPSTSAGPEDLPRSWWDTNYAHRKQMTIMNNVASTLSSGYSICVTIDTASLVSAGKMMTNGNDLRIVYWNESSLTWVELDRHIIDMNTTSTQVWFKTQANIPASGSDHNYYMYYGNPTAINPPAYWSDSMGADSPSRVFWYADSFEEHANNTDPDGWTDEGSEDYKVVVYEGNRWLKRVVRVDWTGGSVATSMSNIGDAVWMVDIRYNQSGSNVWGGIAFHYANGGVGYHFLIRDQGWYWANEDWTVTDGWNTNTDIHFTLGQTGTIKVITVGTTAYCYWENPNGESPSQVLVTTKTIASGTGKAKIIVESPSVDNNRWIDADNFIVRKYVEPEPSTSLGTEETITYDYVLKVVNQVAEDWKINLKVYDSFNIDCLSSTTISVYNETTTSDQIIVSGGVITQSEGPVYDLLGSAIIYISISNLQATTADTSYLYVYLKILAPGTSTYNLFVITLEIA